MANSYFACHQAAHAAETAYIAQDEGSNAVLDINIPAEHNWKAKVNRPMCTPNSLHTALES